MRLLSLAAACALLCAGTLSACGFYFEELVFTAKKEQVPKLMTALHKGDKAPLARTRAEIEKETPDWEQLAKDAKAFSELSELLKSIGSDRYRSPEKYISSVAALTKAAKDKDHKAAKTAFAGLSASCVSCHFYHVPGK